MASIVMVGGRPHFAKNSNAWVNATDLGKLYGKKPVDWLTNLGTKQFIRELCAEYETGEGAFVRTRRGGDTREPKTWLHPLLAVPFTGWLLGRRLG